MSQGQAQDARHDAALKVQGAWSGGCKRPVEMGGAVFVVVALTPYGRWHKEAKEWTDRVAHTGDKVPHDAWDERFGHPARMWGTGKQAAAQQTDRVCGNTLGRAQLGNCQRRHICESSSSCAQNTRPAAQPSCIHASQSSISTVAQHKNRPRQSKQLMHAAILPVVLNSAIASAVTSANPAAAVHTSHAPLRSVAAPTHR
jgi:hypothetical protein